MNRAIGRNYSDYRTAEYVNEFKEFVGDLRKTLKNDPESQKKAREVLIGTGIADKNGHIKEKIISWE